MGTFAPGQIVVVFRNRLHPDGVADYEARAAEIEGLARQMPGFVDVKSFTASDGERVTVSTFADEESVRAWREHTEHRVAQRQGRSTFYSEYTIQVGETIRATEFTRP